jgi:hypothetical protein
MGPVELIDRRQLTRGRELVYRPKWASAALVCCSIEWPCAGCAILKTRGQRAETREVDSRELSRMDQACTGNGRSRDDRGSLEEGWRRLAIVERDSWISWSALRGQDQHNAYSLCISSIQQGIQVYECAKARLQ